MLRTRDPKKKGCFQVAADEWMPVRQRARGLEVTPGELQARLRGGSRRRPSASQALRGTEQRGQFAVRFERGLLSVLKETVFSITKGVLKPL